MYDRSTAVCNIAIARTAKLGSAPSAISIRRDKEPLHAHLCCSVEIEWADCLVRTNTEHFLDVCFKRGLDDILRPQDVRLDCLKRVVLARLNLLQSSSVNNDINALHSHAKTVEIANIANKTAQNITRSVAPNTSVLSKKLRLLVFITAKDPYLLRLIMFYKEADEIRCEAASPACDQDSFFVPVHTSSRSFRSRVQCLVTVSVRLGSNT